MSEFSNKSKSRLVKHLTGRGPPGIGVCPDAPKGVAELDAAADAWVEKEKRKKRAGAPASSSASDSSSSSSKKARQMTIAEGFARQEDAEVRT
jgi:hypothetical protein